MSLVGTSEQWRKQDLDEEQIEDNVHQRKLLYDVSKSNSKRNSKNSKLLFGNNGEVNVKELNPHMIHPLSVDDATGGSKIVVIAKPGFGKSRLISSLLYYKKHIFPVAQIMSGTEDSNAFYSDKFPNLFIYPKLNVPAIESFVKRQKYAKKHLQNPWAVQLLDDCTDDPKILKSPLFQGIFKNGRQWSMFHILSLQYSMDILPVIRTCVDGTFLLREGSRRNRKVLWENYAACIPTFDDFCDLMDEITVDYTSMFINNRVQSNNFDDCVFYYRANLDKMPEKWKFGCKPYWDFSSQRYDNNYVDPVIV
jgi:hypothetical protein